MSTETRGDSVTVVHEPVLTGDEISISSLSLETLVDHVIHQIYFFLTQNRADILFLLSGKQVNNAAQQQIELLKYAVRDVACG